MSNISIKLIWRRVGFDCRHTAKDWSLEMYNDKTHTPTPFSRAPMQNGGDTPTPRRRMRDIPMGDRLDAMQPRRRCDGSLQGTAPENTQPRRCDGSLRNSGNGDSSPDFLGIRLGDALRNSQEPSCPSNCATGRCGGWGLEDHPLAMVYSPCQAWRDAYPPDVALNRGTLFSELDLPLEASKCKRGCM